MIRKLVSVVEELSAEPGAGPNEPVRRAAAAAVIEQPVGRAAAASTTCSAEVERIAPVVAVALTDRLADALGGAERHRGVRQGRRSSAPTARSSMAPR